MSETVELNEETLQRKNLIIRNLQEVLGDEKLTKQLSNGKNIHIYWGTATTGRPHVGYFVPMQKIADLLHAEVQVTILFADLHAFLDNLKSTFVLLENRVLYYQHVITALLSALNVPIDKLKFVKGSTYQLTEEYTRSLLKLCGQVSQRDALRAGAEVVKQVENPLLSGLLYPLLQALDEQFLKVDGQIGGVDQRKIFILAEEQLPKLKFTKRFHLMNPMVPGLTGSKMSSSEENTKIDLLDSAEVVDRKVHFATCPPKSQANSIAENGILSFFKYVVLPILQNKPNKSNSANLKIGGQIYTDYISIEADYKINVLSEETLKTYLSQFLNRILDQVRKKCDSEEIKSIIEKAYPLIAADKGVETNIKKNIADEIVGFNEANAQRFYRILNGLEVLNPLPIKRTINKIRPIRVLYRCAIKGRVNLSHFAALLQLKRLQSAHSCECLIMISDLEAYFDNAKCAWTVLENRTKYYETILVNLMRTIDLKNVKIVHSTEFQYRKDFVLEMYKVVSKVTRDETALVTSNTLASHLCPVYFFLDLCYGVEAVDVLLIGESKRKFFEFSQRIEKQMHMSNCLPSAFILPEIVGMDGNRMSSSQPEFHLEPFDTVKQIIQKISRSFCEPGNLNGNVTLSLAKSVVFVMLNLQKENGSAILTIERSKQNGGNLSVRNYKELEELFVSQKLHPADLKAFIAGEINKIFEPIRKIAFETDFKKILLNAFPKSNKNK